MCSLSALCNNANLVATTTPQTLDSPGYPNDYANGMSCDWNVTAPVGDVIYIQLTFLETEGCCDFLTITGWCLFTLSTAHLFRASCITLYLMPCVTGLQSISYKFSTLLHLVTYSRIYYAFIFSLITLKTTLEGSVLYPS